MASEKKYKLGDMEFETEQEYREAAADLKKIRNIMAKYNVKDPSQAQLILTSIQSHPQAFQSPYGKKFKDQLEKTAGAQASGQAAPEPEAKPQAASVKQAPAAKEKKKEKPEKAKRTKAEKKNKPEGGGEKKGKFQIFSVRNFAVLVVIVAAVILLSLFAPQLFSPNNSKSGSGDIQRNMVTAYAKGQAELQAQLYSYYFDVLGESEDEAKKDAQAAITDNYVLDLSGSTVSRMSASEIEDIYGQLVDGGDIQNNSFVEPSEITVLKEKLTSAGLSGVTGNGTAGEANAAAVVNSMMNYQYRIYTALCYDYSLLDYSQADCEAYANEDMAAIFGDVIFSYNLSDDEKETYYQNFLQRGLISGNSIVPVSADPQDYNLPDLTPTIEVALHGEDAKTYQCSMLNYAPGASVFYEFHSDEGSGYICFRNNGDDTKYIQLDQETSVTIQGDFYILDGNGLSAGEWFHNNENIGIFMDGTQDGLISDVNDLTY